ncbi:MAG TPA: NAD(P)/FAD-dependent oxidoreductase [Kofleriaceae bacterium]|nr:NAD(P)/FAD-dependent oxidoreductase [Kofleriaceae bacterium]
MVGAGPNGLSAAIEIARAGRSVLVLEADATPGGGCRTDERTLAGFAHDVCSTVHPLGAASPFFRGLDLEGAGVSWLHSPAALAHVLGDGRVVTLERSLDETAAQLGRDGDAYVRLMRPLVERFDDLLEMVLGPLRWPTHLRLMARFGRDAIRSMEGLARARFREDAAPALLGGIAAHSMVTLDSLATASFALVLGAAGHAVGWPIARGGSRAITDALVTRLKELGGEVLVSHHVTSLAHVPRARAYILDVAPRQMLEIAGARLPGWYRRRLANFRYGPGVFKIDWALREPVPWRDARCARAATVHLSGTLDDIAAAERAPHAGEVAARPFVLFVQPSLFDPTRAPAGMHTGWAYCHVPSGWSGDATAAIEDQIERHAPGFREVILRRASVDASQLAAYNPNYVGGDINAGLSDVRQLFFRPMPRVDPYMTPAGDVFVCSSSTPPGGGVHGMCGYWAAQSALGVALRSRYRASGGGGELSSSKGVSPFVPASLPAS